MGAMSVTATSATQNTGADVNQVQDLRDIWCVEVSPLGADTITLENGEVASSGCQGSIDEHNNVSFDFYRSSPSTVENTNQVPLYFVADVSTNARSDSTAEVEFLRDGSSIESKTIELGENDREAVTVQDTVAASNSPYGNYSIRLSVFDGQDDLITERTVDVGEFGINPSQASITSGEQSDPAERNVSVIPDTQDRQLQGVQTDVSRYNDETIIESELQDTSIPPLNQDTSSNRFRNTGVGELTDFGNLRQSEGGLNNDAAIRSVNLGGQEQINFGTASYGIPQAENHDLVVSYAMQTESPASEGIGIEIVDRQGNVIDDEIDAAQGIPEERLLSDTVLPSVGYGGEQFSGASDDPRANNDALSTRTERITLTDEEVEYINNNFEAYVQFRTPENGSDGGLTIFKPNRVYFISSDTQTFDIEANPQIVEQGENIEFSIEEYTADILTSSVNQTNGQEENPEVQWHVINEDTGSEEVFDVNYSESEVQNNEEIINNFSTSETGNYTVRLVVNPVNEPEFNVRESFTVFEEGSVGSGSATFDVSYSVNNSINAEYGTYDIAPVTDTLRLDVDVQNRGNSEVRRDIAVLDTKEGEFGYTDRVRGQEEVSVGPNSSTTVNFQIDWEPHEFGPHTVTVIDRTRLDEGEDPEIVREDTEGTETSVYVLQPATMEISDISNPPEHLVEDNFDVAAELVNVGDLSTDHPSSQGLVLEGRFANQWDTEVSVDQLDLQGGDVRAGEEGTYRRFDFDRTSNEYPTGLDYIPDVPFTTTDERDSVNSPYGLETGSQSLEFETRHDWASANQSIQDSLDDSERRIVDLYKLDILSLSVSMDGTETGYTSQIRDPSSTSTTFDPPIAFPSPFPFTEEHYTHSFEEDLGGFDIYQDPRTYEETNVDTGEDVIPTTGITEFQGVGPQDSTTARNSRARITVQNDGTAQTGVARVVLRTADGSDITHTDYSEQLLDGQAEWWSELEDSDSVVGVASTQLDAYEVSQLEVPLIIPNHPDNADRVIKLEAQIRSSDDYAQKYDNYNTSTGGVQTFELETRSYGDGLLVESIVDDANASNEFDGEVDQVCEAEYIDHSDPIGLGDCGSQNTELNVDFTHENVGSAPIEDTPINLHYYMNTPQDIISQEETIADHYQEQYEMRDASNDILTTDDATSFLKENPDYWGGNNTYDIDPLTSQTNTFNNQFLEPGLYSLHVTDHRIIENPHDFGNLANENGGITVLGQDGIDYDRDFGNQEHLEQEANLDIMVWDTFDPVSRAHARDCTSSGGGTSQYGGIEYDQCLEDEYNGLSSTTTFWNAPSSEDDNDSYDIYEGGALQLEGEQIESLTPEEAEEAQLSSDNVGVRSDSYDWNIQGEGDINRLEDDGTIIHRFNDPGEYTVTLTVEDHPEYVEGDGANQDTSSFTVNVKPDNDDPFVDLTQDGWDTNYTDNDNVIWAGSPEDRSGLFTTSYWSATVSDSEIGVEEGVWDITQNPGEITYEEFTIDNFGTFDAEVEWEDRSSGSQSGDTSTLEFTATDFAGNTASDDESVQVYKDETDPDADYFAMDDWIWASYDPTGFSDSTTYNASNSVDRGNPSVGLHEEAYDHSVAGSWRISSTISTGYDTSTTDIRTEEESVEVRDWYGNSDIADASVTVVTDNDDPVKDECSEGSEGNGYDCYDSDVNVDGEPDGSASSNWPTSFTNSASAEACIVIEEVGPSPYGSVGINSASASDDGSITSESNTSVTACVEADADPSASASANASQPPCDSSDNVDYGDDYDKDDETSTSTVTVEDNHGNSASWEIRAYAEADAYDTARDRETSDPCPPPPPPPPPPMPPIGPIM